MTVCQLRLFRSMLFLVPLTAWGSAVAVAAPPDPIRQLEELAPKNAAECQAARIDSLVQTAQAVEGYLAESSWPAAQATFADWLVAVERILGAKKRVDSCLARSLELRTPLGQAADSPQARDGIREHLRATAALIDLSGRIRFLQRDLIDDAAFALDRDLSQFEKLLELLTRERSSIGAAAMSYVLFDPDASRELQPYPPAIKARAIQLIRAAQDVERIGDLAAFLRAPSTTAEQCVMATLAIRHLGLPQEGGPREPGSELPAPAITAREIATRLSGLRKVDLSPSSQRQRDELLAWLQTRISQGIPEDTFRVGALELQPGDWLLMRNPSPYNRFTDISPGLFTHVGIVTQVKDAHGRQRYVIVDLPERGDHIPATNVEIFLQRTLHYVFLRHEDRQTALKMAEVARRIAGRPSQFDLTFRTERVREIRHAYERVDRIHTYCAGLLLLCAQETERPESNFFPFTEKPASETLQKNLSALGMSIGEGFLSPTGALYSGHLRTVGSLEPMYSPFNEIRDAVYDHFADRMARGKLTPAPGTTQLLREKLAGLSKFNPWLAKTLAQANRVNENMDLESAAKAAAVVETLDEIAAEAAQGFGQSWDAVRMPAEELPMANDAAHRARQQFIELANAWSREEISPRELRLQLVRYWADWGQRRIRQRFFVNDPLTK